jgi:hypothetical protein
MLIPIPLDAP